jgi:hypothetical protein
LSKIVDALEALQSANAISGPLPDLPWLARLRKETPSNPTNVKPIDVIPSYDLPGPSSTLPLSFSPPETPTRNTSTPKNSETTIPTAEGVPPECFSSVGTDYVTTFQEVASKSESSQIDAEIPTPNSVGQAGIADEVTSEDISHDSLPHNIGDTNSNVHSTDTKPPQIHAETEIEKSL